MINVYSGYLSGMLMISLLRTEHPCDIPRCAADSLCGVKLYAFQWQVPAFLRVGDVVSFNGEYTSLLTAVAHFSGDYPLLSVMGTHFNSAFHFLAD